MDLRLSSQGLLMGRLYCCKTREGEIWCPISLVSGLGLALPEQLKCCLMAKMKIISEEASTCKATMAAHVFRLRAPRLSVVDVSRQKMGQSGAQVVCADKLLDISKERLYKH